MRGFVITNEPMHTHLIYSHVYNIPIVSSVVSQTTSYEFHLPRYSLHPYGVKSKCIFLMIWIFNNLFRHEIIVGLFPLCVITFVPFFTEDYRFLHVFHTSWQLCNCLMPFFHLICIWLILLSCQGPPNSSTPNASGGAKSNKKSGGQKKSSEAAGSTQPSRFF